MKNRTLRSDHKPATWCSVCNLRVAPYEPALVLLGDQFFHRHCLERRPTSAAPRKPKLHVKN